MLLVVLPESVVGGATARPKGAPAARVGPAHRPEDGQTRARGDEPCGTYGERREVRLVVVAVGERCGCGGALAVIWAVIFPWGGGVVMGVLFRVEWPLSFTRVVLVAGQFRL